MNLWKLPYIWFVLNVIDFIPSALLAQVIIIYNSICSVRNICVSQIDKKFAVVTNNLFGKFIPWTFRIFSKIFWEFGYTNEFENHFGKSIAWSFHIFAKTFSDFRCTYQIENQFGKSTSMIISHFYTVHSIVNIL